jgi:type I restriction-modification system DNA methylase subunit
MPRRQKNDSAKAITDGNTSTSHSAVITQKVWNMCDVLRDDGVSYSDYLEQITYLIFIKMFY